MLFRNQLSYVSMWFKPNLTSLLLFIISILCLSKIAKAQQSVFSVDEIPAMEQKAHEGKTKSLSSGVGSNYDLKYHRCVWEIDPAVSFIKGNITSYFKTIINGFNQMEFDFTTTLTVDSIMYHGNSISFTQQSSDVLQINIPSIIPINTLDSVTVFYQGIPPNDDTASFYRTTHNGTPIIWTLSEPFGAKDWWPCKQSLTDKIDSLDIIVTTPQQNKVGSNGILLSTILSGNNITYHWKTKYAIAAYLVGIAVTNYSSYSDFVLLQNGDSLEVLNYVYPENLATAQSQSQDIINIIKFYDSLTIEYPFSKEKYGHAQFNWSGGMEHQTMTFLNNFNHALMAHECAHQWFGDHVTCASWQDIWLNEGFATYFEGLTEERYFPNTWMAWKQQKITNITSLPGGSVLCDDTTSAKRIFSGRLSYDKGAYVLHMLRRKLGDSLFFLSLKNYLNDSLLAGNYAHTIALINHLEATSGQSLSGFFNDWYYSQGYPSYHIVWNQSGSAVTLTVDQTQSHSSVSFFEMPIEILFIGQTKDTTIIFDHTYSAQIFSATINFPITRVKFDPELRIISAGNTITEKQEYISDDNQVTVYPNPTKDVLNILLLNNANTVEYFEITDDSGKTIFKSDTYSGTQKLITISTSSFSKGTYFIKLVLKSGMNFKSFVKL